MIPEISIAKIYPDVTAYLLNTDGLAASKVRRQQTILPFQIFSEDKSCPYWTEDSPGTCAYSQHNASQGLSSVVSEAIKSVV